MALLGSKKSYAVILKNGKIDFRASSSEHTFLQHFPPMFLFLDILKMSNFLDLTDFFFEFL
jgi:hypothetical protein